MGMPLRTVAGAVLAFIACPCHLPLTGPLLLGLLAGTALGNDLAAHPERLAVGATGLFLLGLALAFWPGPSGSARASPCGSYGSLRRLRETRRS